MPYISDSPAFDLSMDLWKRQTHDILQTKSIKGVLKHALALSREWNLVHKRMHLDESIRDIRFGFNMPHSQRPVGIKGLTV